MAVGVYSVEAAWAALAWLMLGRLPRSRPEPRVVPNEGAADGAGLVAVASAGAPDDSWEDMSMLLVKSACQWVAAPVGGAGRSSKILLTQRHQGNKVAHPRW